MRVILFIITNYITVIMTVVGNNDSWTTHSVVKFCSSNVSTRFNGTYKCGVGWGEMSQGEGCVSARILFMYVMKAGRHIFW